jgi:hypothetical protein
MKFKPTWSSFFGSVAFALSPAATAGVVTFFLWENTRTPVLIAGALMIIFSLLLLLQAILVHLKCVYVDEQFIAVAGPLIRTQIRWSEVMEGVLKERHNAMTRTDRLLILRGPSCLVTYNTSTLSQRDERRLLEFVRSKCPMVVEQSKPSI